MISSRVYLRYEGEKKGREKQKSREKQKADKQGRVEKQKSGKAKKQISREKHRSREAGTPKSKEIQNGERNKPNKRALALKKYAFPSKTIYRKHDSEAQLRS